MSERFPNNLANLLKSRKSENAGALPHETLLFVPIVYEADDEIQVVGETPAPRSRHAMHVWRE